LAGAETAIKAAFVLCFTLLGVLVIDGFAGAVKMFVVDLILSTV
jgi:hypothetical protein